ncbi:MAG: tol-pal system protein YbgF [Paraglaciecola sp.]|jgi:tol-pal system protein YbgF
MIKRTFALGLLCVMGAAVNAAPAPVVDVNGASNVDRITALESMFTARTTAQHRIQEQLEALQNEVNELRGSVELHNYQLEKILERQRELYLEIDKRFESIVAQPSNEQTSVVAAPLSANENDAYDKAVNLILRDKSYDQAIPEFQAFLLNYPNSDYVPNAHYWLGQLLFNKLDWAGAADQFKVIVNKYTDSGKRPEAMLKLGISESERSNVARAKQLWQQVVSEYPDTSAGKLADKRLKNLNAN